MPTFIDRKFRLKPNQARVATLRMSKPNDFTSNRQISPQHQQYELSYLRKKHLTHSEQTMCECVVEHTGNISDDITWKDAWLCVASEHKILEYGKLEKV